MKESEKNVKIFVNYFKDEVEYTRGSKTMKKC